MSISLSAAGCLRVSSWSFARAPSGSAGSPSPVRRLRAGRRRGGTHRDVSMYPGDMQLTRIPAGAHSTAREAASCRTAALEQLYGLRAGSLASVMPQPSSPPVAVLDLRHPSDTSQRSLRGRPGWHRPSTRYSKPPRPNAGQCCERGSVDVAGRGGGGDMVAEPHRTYTRARVGFHLASGAESFQPTKSLRGKLQPGALRAEEKEKGKKKRFQPTPAAGAR